MSAPHHTRGPWEMIVPADNLWSPRVFAGSKFIGMIDNSDDTQEQRIADARLIAAAPDLLAALEMALAELDGNLFADWGDAARAAIAKAKGGEQ